MDRRILISVLQTIAAEDHEFGEYVATAGMKDKLKAFLKSSIVPTMMALGPVACGVDESKPSAQAIEQDLNSEIKVSIKNLSCDVRIKNDGSSVLTFIADIRDSDKGSYVKDTLQFEFEGASDDEAEMSVSSPKTDAMNVFKDTVLDVIRELGKDKTKQKYECSVRYNNQTVWEAAD